MPSRPPEQPSLPPCFLQRSFTVQRFRPKGPAGLRWRAVVLRGRSSRGGGPGVCQPRIGAALSQDLPDNRHRQDDKHGVGGPAAHPVHSRTSYSNATPSGSFSSNHVSAAAAFANTLTYPCLLPVSVRSHDSNPRHHRRAAAAAQHQYLDCRLPFRQVGFLFRQAGYVVGGVAKRDQHSATRQWNVILEFALPALVSHQRKLSCLSKKTFRASLFLISS